MYPSDKGTFSRRRKRREFCALLYINVFIKRFHLASEWQLSCFPTLRRTGTGNLWVFPLTMHCEHWTYESSRPATDLFSLWHFGEAVLIITKKLAVLVDVGCTNGCTNHLLVGIPSRPLDSASFKDEISIDLQLLYLEHCFAAQDHPGSKRGAVGQGIAAGSVKIRDGSYRIDGWLQRGWIVATKLEDWLNFADWRPWSDII